MLGAELPSPSACSIGTMTITAKDGTYAPDIDNTLAVSGETRRAAAPLQRASALPACARLLCLVRNISPIATVAVAD